MSPPRVLGPAPCSLVETQPDDGLGLTSVLRGWLSSRSSEVKGICVRTGMSADSRLQTRGRSHTHCSLQRATNAALTLPGLNNVVTLPCLTCGDLAQKRETKREGVQGKNSKWQAEFLTSHVHRRPCDTLLNASYITGRRLLTVSAVAVTRIAPWTAAEAQGRYRHPKSHTEAARVRVKAGLDFSPGIPNTEQTLEYVCLLHSVNEVLPTST